VTYKAIVCQLTNVRRHPGADRLNLANILGYQVVVGLDNTEGELGAFFNTDGQLSEAFATKNDLIRRKNSDGSAAGGMFDANRKVRAQRLRGEKSDGFWIPLSAFKFTGYDLSKLKPGFEFSELNGVEICTKYVTQATLRARAKQAGRQARNELKMFRKHFETEQFRNVAEKIPGGSLLIITEKQHGTSHRIGHVLDQKKLHPIMAWVYRTLRRPFPRQWTYLHGSRNIILDGGLNDPYYNSQFRQVAVNKLEGNLHKGEVVYLEIVGYINDTTPIMPIHNAAKTKDKELIKFYGKEMVYRYGNIPGQCSPAVYRIVMVNEDGVETELSWEQVKRRCRELNVPHVPEVTPPFIYDGNTEALRTLCEKLSVGPSTVDLTHIREGICIRVERSVGMSISKLKNFSFTLMESDVKDSDDVVDLEEAA
jgi:hypothetical protein